MRFFLFDETLNLNKCNLTKAQILFFQCGNPTAARALNNVLNNLEFQLDPLGGLGVASVGLNGVAGVGIHPSLSSLQQLASFGSKTCNVLQLATPGHHQGHFVTSFPPQYITTGGTTSLSSSPQPQPPQPGTDPIWDQWASLRDRR